VGHYIGHFMKEFIVLRALFYSKIKTTSKMLVLKPNLYMRRIYKFYPLLKLFPSFTRTLSCKSPILGFLNNITFLNHECTNKSFKSTISWNTNSKAIIFNLTLSYLNITTWLHEIVLVTMTCKWS
jgi:hypothetical protein